MIRGDFLWSLCFICITYIFCPIFLPGESILLREMAKLIHYGAFQGFEAQKFSSTMEKNFSASAMRLA